MENNLRIINNPKKFKKQIIDLYCKSFNFSRKCAEFDLKYNISLKNSVAIVDGEKLISFVGVSIKKILQNNIERKIALIGSVMTHEMYKNKGYANLLIDKIEDKLIKKFDSVIIQTHHWNIYKNQDLIESSVKKQVKLKIQPVDRSKPFLNRPNHMLIKTIEYYHNDEYTGLIKTNKQIKATIKHNIESNLKFIAYGNAYIWYDNNNKIDNFFYSNLEDLINLYSYIKSTDVILIFDNKDFLYNIDKMRVLDNVVVTKTFSKSKNIFKNINIQDFEL